MKIKMKNPARKISGGIENVFLRTRQSLKIFEAIEKAPLQQAKRLADRGLQLSTLKLLGFVTQSDLESLRIRVEELEAQVTLLTEQAASKRRKAAASKSPGLEE